MTRQTTRDILAAAERARRPRTGEWNPLLEDGDEGEAPSAHRGGSTDHADDYNPLLDTLEDDPEAEGYSHSDEAGEEIEEFALPGVGSLKAGHGWRSDLEPEDEPEPEAAPTVVEPPEVVVEPAVPSRPVAEAAPIINDDIDSLLGLSPGLDLDEEADSEEDPFSEDDLAEIFERGHGLPEDTHSPGFQEAWGGVDDELLDGDDDHDEDEFQGFDLDTVLSTAIDLGASDVDLMAGDQVSFAILGEMHRAEDFGGISGDVTQRLQQSIISHVLEAEFVEELELDTSYVLRTGPHKGRRTRLSVGRSMGEVFLVFRVIADQIPTPQQLDITGELLDWAKLPNGLVLVCGPTGTGKSTTFASLVNEINMSRRQKIITLEKPIEYVYPKGMAVIMQREIGRDARSFAKSLTSAMRQHPDIIMVGEVRNQEEISELLRASESGHLAMSTMHTNSAAATINRIQSLFEGDEQKRILGSLSDNLRGIANQVLIKTKDGNSRFAVREVLPVDEEVADLVLHGDTRGIRAYQIERESTMEHELVKAVVQGKCTVEAARSQSPFPRYFDELLRKAS